MIVRALVGQLLSGLSVYLGVTLSALLGSLVGSGCGCSSNLANILTLGGVSVLSNLLLGLSVSL